MNILYVYAHPSQASFNYHLKELACNVIREAGHPLVVSDLYTEQFNPVADFNDFRLAKSELDPQYFASQQIAYNKHQLSVDIETEIDKLRQADHIILQFPLWWFSAPAILKGWLDRVLVKGFAYDKGKILSDGLLKGKTASLTVTTQSDEDAYQLQGSHQSTIDQFLLPIHHTLRFVGIQVVDPFVEYGVFNVDENRKREVMTRYSAYLRDLIGKRV